MCSDKKTWAKCFLVHWFESFDIRMNMFEIQFFRYVYNSDTKQTYIQQVYNSDGKERYVHHSVVTTLIRSSYIQQFYSIFFVLDTLKSIYSTRPRFASVEATSKSPMKKRILSRIPLQDSSSCDPPLLTSLFEFRVELLPFLCLLEPRYRWISPWWTR